MCQSPGGILSDSNLLTAQSSTEDWQAGLQGANRSNFGRLLESLKHGKDDNASLDSKEPVKSFSATWLYTGNSVLSFLSFVERLCGSDFRWIRAATV